MPSLDDEHIGILTELRVCAIEREEAHHRIVEEARVILGVTAGTFGQLDERMDFG